MARRGGARTKTRLVRKASFDLPGRTCSPGVASPPEHRKSSRRARIAQHAHRHLGHPGQLRRPRRTSDRVAPLRAPSSRRPHRPWRSGGEPLMTCRHRWAALAAVPGRAHRAPGSSSGCAACPVRAYADQAGVWQACVQPRTAMPSVVTVGRPLVPATMIFRVCLLDHDQVLVQIACR